MTQELKLFGVKRLILGKAVKLSSRNGYAQDLVIVGENGMVEVTLFSEKRMKLEKTQDKYPAITALTS